MDPDDATARGLTTIDSVAQWSGLDGARDDAQTPRGALFALLGLVGTEPPRILGVLPAADLDASIRQWRVPQAAPNPPAAPTIAQLGQAGVFARTCRYLCGLLPHQMTPAPMPAAPAATGTGAKKIKMATVINQTDDNEVEQLTPAVVSQAYQVYHQKTGGFPPDDEELSTEQLSSLHAVFMSKRAPYTDMAVWGPFHHRIQKKMKMKGLRFSPTGEIVPVELYGPPDFEAWRECYMVFRTGAIMFEQISPARLDMYEKTIRSYAERYGRPCWPIIYQADVRARLEHVERLRRRGEQEYTAAQNAGLTHEYEPNKPWNWVWRQLCDDFNFWNREVIEPCMLYLAKSANLQTLVEQDAPVAKSAPSSSSTTPAVAPPPPPVASPRTAQIKRQRGPDIREHRVGDDGHFTHNRRGVELCKLFQTGECLEVDGRGNCIRNNSRRHQCAKCLSDRHGAAKCPVDTVRPPRQNHGRGKGKGRGRK